MNNLKIKRSYLEELYAVDNEIMLDVGSDNLLIDKRPHVVVFRLKYKDKTYPFAIPLRSNIKNIRCRKTYYPLPVLPIGINKTRVDCLRGIDYSKIFPCKTNETDKIRMNEDYKKYTFQHIKDNKNNIKNEAQLYLDNYEENVHEYSTKIDILLNHTFYEKYNS